MCIRESGSGNSPLDYSVAFYLFSSAVGIYARVRSDYIVCKLKGVRFFDFVIDGEVAFVVVLVGMRLLFFAVI